jgi:hypothetical protein
LEHTGDIPSIPFLDTSTKDNTIATELYIEPMHSCSGILLHYSSAHPTSTKVATGIAFSQMNGALRVSSIIDASHPRG